MDICILVRLPDLIVIDFREPVIRRNRAGVAQDQTADRICHRRVFLDSPVRHFDIAVHDLFIVEKSRIQIAYLLPLFPVQDIPFRHIIISCLDKNGLHTVLYVLHRD